MPFYHDSIASSAPITFPKSYYSAAGETNADIFDALWRGFGVSLASAFVILFGVIICALGGENGNVGLLFIFVGALFLAFGVVTTYWAIDIVREHAQADIAARKPRIAEPSSQWRAPFPPPNFVERVYALAQNNKVPPVRQLAAEFPTAQERLEQMAKAGAIIGRTERGDGGTLVWTLQRSLDAARFANPGYAPPTQPDVD